jgi:alcohol dehydrogenase class IV
MHDPSDLFARGQMQLGSCLAGMAFANAPVGAVHALAYPIGVRHHAPHGLSNALMLLPVLQFNMRSAAPLYDELAVSLCLEQADAAGLFKALADLIAGSGLPSRLRDIGALESDLPLLAEDAMRQTRLLVNNPVEVTLDDALALYRAAF